MSFLIEDASAWVGGVYQLEESDDVIGGADGVSNLQAKQLADRTSYLLNRTLASIRLEGITQVTGTHTISQDDIGQVLSVHDPSTAQFQLPALSSFPKGMPLTIVITDTGSDSVPLMGLAGDTIEDFLNAGGVTSYPLEPGTRLVMIATTTSWVIILKDSPVTVVGYNVGDIKFTFAPHTVAQPGFLLAIGQTVSRVTYANLFSVYGTLYGVGDGSTTFKLPDARDLFLRVYNGGSVRDLGRIYGAVQEDAVGPHEHTIHASENGTANGSETFVAWSDNEAVEPGLVTTSLKTGAGSGTAAETRPANLGFNAWIKY
jgi:microcystin-dependent protein